MNTRNFAGIGLVKADRDCLLGIELSPPLLKPVGRGVDLALEVRYSANTIFIRRVVECFVGEKGKGRILVYGDVVGANDV